MTNFTLLLSRITWICNGGDWGTLHSAVAVLSIAGQTLHLNWKAICEHWKLNFHKFSINSWKMNNNIRIFTLTANTFQRNWKKKREIQIEICIQSRSNYLISYIIHLLRCRMWKQNELFVLHVHLHSRRGCSYATMLQTNWWKLPFIIFRNSNDFII